MIVIQFTSPSETEMKWMQHFERKVEQVHGNRIINTAFLDPRQLELAEAVLKKKATLSYTVYGGHPRAERNALSIFPAQQKTVLPPLKALKIKWKGDQDEISHRDLLGAILGLGLKREQIGDIILFEGGGAAVFVEDDKADFVRSNLLQVGRITVTCEVIDPEQIPFSKDDGKDIKGTVASLRIDAVLSLGFGISRSRVVLLIKGGAVSINWKPISSPSIQLNEGDQVSLKGRGRLLVDSVEGETRKGRIRLKLKKYS
ncbi:MAG: RNA-binding protein [Bacillota bacterium]